MRSWERRTAKDTWNDIKATLQGDHLESQIPKFYFNIIPILFFLWIFFFLSLRNLDVFKKRCFFPLVIMIMYLNMELKYCLGTCVYFQIVVRIYFEAFRCKLRRKKNIVIYFIV